MNFYVWLDWFTLVWCWSRAQRFFQKGADQKNMTVSETW